MSVAAPRTVANRAAGTRAPGGGTTPAAPGFPLAFASSGPTASATRAAPAPTSPMVQTCQTPSQDFMAASRTSAARDESRPLERAELTAPGDKGRGSIRPSLRLPTNVQRSCSSPEDSATGQISPDSKTLTIGRPARHSYERDRNSDLFAIPRLFALPTGSIFTILLLRLSSQGPGWPGSWKSPLS